MFDLITNIMLSSDGRKSAISDLIPQDERLNKQQRIEYRLTYVIRKLRTDYTRKCHVDLDVSFFSNFHDS